MLGRSGETAVTKANHIDDGRAVKSYFAPTPSLVIAVAACLASNAQAQSGFRMARLRASFMQHALHFLDRRLASLVLGDLRVTPALRCGNLPDQSEVPPLQLA